MHQLTGMTVLLAALCAPVHAAERTDPFGTIIDAARRSATAAATATGPEPTRSVIALPKSLRVPHPEPGPARTAVHAHAGPDGRITYACTVAHPRVEEARP